MAALRCALLVLLLFAAGALPAQDSEYEPVHPDRLIATMPEAVPAFEAAEPRKTLAEQLGSKFTMVSRVYTKTHLGWFEDDDEVKPTVTIKMTDSAGNKSFVAMHEKLAEMGQSATSGFSNALSVDGHLAIKNYREKDQSGLLSLYVADRFLVQIAVKGLEEKALMDWWQKIDSAKLAALAVPPTPTPAPTQTPVQASSR